jgi:hypothetical protein
MKHLLVHRKYVKRLPLQLFTFFFIYLQPHRPKGFFLQNISTSIFTFLLLFTAELCLFYKSSVVDPYCFNADPDPSFYLNVDMDPDPGSQTYLKPRRIRIRIMIRLLRQKTRFICKFRPISMLLDPDPHSQYGMDPGPRQPNECGSKWIQNTA